LGRVGRVRCLERPFPLTKEYRAGCRTAKTCSAHAPDEVVKIGQKAIYAVTPKKVYVVTDAMFDRYLID